MSLRNFVRELKAGGPKRSSSSSSSSSSIKSSLPNTWHRPNQSEEEIEQTGTWANLPSELLLDIVTRIEESDVAWPERRNVVACAAVCRSWREATKEAVTTLQLSARFTFPVSLKQPAPREHPIQCFVRRDRSSSTFRLYLGLSPSLHGENDKLLLAAKKVRRATGTDFIISLASDDFSKNSNTYVGKLRFGRVLNFSDLKPTLLSTSKLRSNFLGTKFTVLDSVPPPSDVRVPPSATKSRINPKQVSPKIPAGNYEIATISYELNMLRTRGPRRMQCTMHHTPLSSLDPVHDKVKPPGPGIKCEPLILKNKAPRWHEQLQCWCLNFRGRVTVASVKNFQLVAAPGAVDQVHGESEGESEVTVPAAEFEKVILQFGKIGKDIFTMDYRYPLSAFQAFAICLTSFDTKPACE